MVGSGGLLGSAVTRSLRRSGGPVLHQRVDWGGPRTAADLSRGLDRMSDTVSRGGPGWRVAWCAGAGVTGTSESDLAREVATLSDFLDDLASRRAAIGTGTVFLASSAGGLYAGSGSGPFTEDDVPVPISAYGRAKLAAEAAATAFAEATGNTVQIGRIANLYGPGQNAAKAQGLITALCRSNISRQPVAVYVSLDTIRDYLYVDDCADMIGQMLHLRRPEGHVRGRPVVKVLASQHGTTIASLIGVCRQVFKRAPLVVLASSPGARFQVRDLRFRSVRWSRIDARYLTTLPAGIAATSAGLLRAAHRPAL